MKLFIDRNVFSTTRPAGSTPRWWATSRGCRDGLQETIAALKRFVALSCSGAVRSFELTGFADKAGDAAANAPLVLRRIAFAEQLGAALREAPDS